MKNSNKILSFALLMVVVMLGGSENSFAQGSGSAPLIWNCPYNTTNTVPYGCIEMQWNFGSGQSGLNTGGNIVGCPSSIVPTSAQNSCYRIILCNVSGIDQCHIEGFTGPNAQFASDGQNVVCSAGYHLMKDASPNNVDTCVLNHVNPVNPKSAPKTN